MKAVDEYIPTPTHDLDKPFLMPIEEQIRDFNRELENGITEEEKQTFLTILDKMMQNLGQDSRRTGRCNGPCRNE